MKNFESTFGKLAYGRIAHIFHFKCEQGMEISITNYGATITAIRIPDKQGKLTDVVAGFDNLHNYQDSNFYFGSCIGRYANRIANGGFSIDGKTYQGLINEKRIQLHGGNEGFHRKLWDTTLQKNADNTILKLHYLSPHLESGFPGNLNATITYTIWDNNRFAIDYEAETDETTHVNFSNHSYFNLSGFTENADSHLLSLDAIGYLELNSNQFPTGKMVATSGTVFDFHKLTLLNEQRIPGQFELDHCFVLDKTNSSKDPDAILFHPHTGIKLKLFTTQPGIQVYSSNLLDGSLTGHQGIKYQKHSAICLTTQHFPDTPNQPYFPSTLLVPGDTYHQSSRYIFELD